MERGLIGQARPQHTESTTQDYAVEIYDDLIKQGD